MTQEEKAKAYDEAIRNLRGMMPNWDRLSYNGKTFLQDLIYIFPELAESENERIKKEVAELVMQPTWKTEKEFHRRKELCDWLKKQGEQKEYTFKSIPRLLDMIEPSDRAKAYCQKLIDTLAKEGYNTDAKIVEEVLKGWNGEDVPMAVMDEQKPAAIDIDKMVDDYANNKERGNEIFGKPVPCMIRAYRQGLNDAIEKVLLKPAWSKEDERIYQSIIDDNVQENLLYNEQINWIISIKQRIS